MTTTGLKGLAVASAVAAALAMHTAAPAAADGDKEKC